MREKIRRFFVVFCVFAMICPFVFQTRAYAAAYHYNPDKAVAWAKKEESVKNTKGECATFVSKCLRKGGLEDVSYSTPGALVEYLEKKGYGTTYKINDENLQKIKAGDVIMVCCSKTHDSSKYWGLHTIFVTEVNQAGKYIRYSARNAEHCNEKMTFDALKKYSKSFDGDCSKCKGKAVAYFVSMKNTSQNTLHSYDNHSGKNYLVGTDFESSLYSSYWSVRGNSPVHSFSVDSTVKHNGYNSLRIVNSSPGASKNDLSIKTLTQGNVDKNGFVGDNKNMVLSFWAKSSSNGTKMYFRYGYEAEADCRTVTLSTDWKRYTVRMDKTKDYNTYIYSYIDRKGTVWLAEVQLEDGTTATEFIPEDRGEYKTVTETVGKKYSLPPAPTWEGHTFLGWFTSASGGTQITGSTAVKDGNFCVYAHWDSYNSGRRIPDNPDLILPAGLTAIREEAFTGGAFSYVKLPEQTVSIGSRAFARCPNLRYVYIPAKTVYDGIAPDAFEGVEDLTILGKAGSAAETYAQKHNFVFISVS